MSTNINQNYKIYTFNELVNMDKNEFNETIKPIGKAIYKQTIDQELNTIEFKNNKNYKLCKICEKYYHKTNTTHHRRSQYHQIHEKINDRLREFLFSK